MYSEWDTHTDEPNQNQTRGFGRGMISSGDTDQSKPSRTMNSNFSPRGRGRGVMRDTNTRAPGFSEALNQNASGSDSVTLYVEINAVSRIIGKGGSNIRNLEDQSGAQVKVSRDRSGGSVAVDVTGTPQQVATASQLINQCTASQRQDNSNGFGGDQGDEASVTLQVESRDVGRIIGKGGSKIRQLQDDSGARINVSRDKSGSTVDVDLSGTAEQVALARELIEEVTSSAGDRGFGGGGGFGRSEGGGFGWSGGGEEFGRNADNSNTFGGDQGDETSVTLQVESRDVGRIIGRGGSKIRQLQDDSGARINVSRDKSGPIVDVDLSGTAEQVAMARELIEEVTSSAGDRGFGGGGGSFGRSNAGAGGWGGDAMQDRRNVDNINTFGGDHGDETSVTLQVESRDVGRIIGKGGSKIRQLQEDSGAHIDVSRDKSGATVDVELSGTAEQVAMARELIDEVTSSAGDRGFGGGGGGGFGRNEGGSFGWSGGGDDMGMQDRKNVDSGNTFGGDHGDETSVTLQVESRDVGRIIGRGGSKIRQLQDDSGARINVSRDKSGSTVDVELSGTAEQVALAQELIDEVTSSAGGQGFGGGGGGGGGFGRSGGEETVMEVDSGEVGKIIGKGGSRIRELQVESGASIEVSRDRGPTVIVTLKGSADAISKAKQLIEDLIEPDQNYGGGGDSNNSWDAAPAPAGASFGSFGASNTQEDWGDECENGTTSNQFNSGQHTDHDNSNHSNSWQKQTDYGQQSRSNSMIFYNSSRSNNNWKEESKEENDGWNAQFGTAPTRDVRPSRDSAPSYCPPRRERTPPRPEPAFVPRINWKALHENKAQNEMARWRDHPPVMKQFYIEGPETANRTPHEIAEIRAQNNNIVVNDLNEGEERDVPNPVLTFGEAFEHYPDIMACIDAAGFTEPTPIQKQAWPCALQGFDWIGIAQTGTGKTLAFLLPAFIHIEGQPTPRAQRKGPTVLVLSPTRELALQIEQETKKYQYKGIRCVCIYGGGSRKNQINVVTKGVEIVVATPGRLNDLIMNGFIDITTVSYLVLDEADRMLDMGFEPEIRKILVDIRPDRQTVMTSATWPEGVRRLATSYLRNPIQIYIGSLDLAAVHSVTQLVEILDDSEKRDRLLDFLQHDLGEEDKIIVFVGKKLTADDIASDFSLQGISCQCIHGDREQYDREQALSDLKTGAVRILVATDVASRGLDIPDITHVLNFDFPRHMEEYVHRVGRTGRAGRTGTSITFMTRSDWRGAQNLIDILVEANQEVPLELEQMAERYQAFRERQRREGGFRGGGGGRGFGGGRGGGRGRRGEHYGIKLNSYI